MTHLRRAATLPVSFFRHPAEKVARELLGARMISLVDGEKTVGRIVETEAERRAVWPAWFLVRVPLLRGPLVRQSGL